MAIEIRVESSWDTDDGEGRSVEVTVLTRQHPADDPMEDTRYFASGDSEKLKRYLCELVDREASRFLHRDRHECGRCGRVVASEKEGPEFVCASCRER